MARAFFTYRDRDTNLFGVLVQPATDGTAQEVLVVGFRSRATADGVRDEIVNNEVAMAEAKAYGRS